MARAAQNAKPVKEAAVTKEVASKAAVAKPAVPKTKKPAPKAPSKAPTGKTSSSASSAMPAVSKNPDPKVPLAPTKVAGKKRERSSEPTIPTKPTKRLKSDLPLNTGPSQKLDVYVFGLGDFGELGLGVKAKNVKRPRINTLLDADTAGVVQIAVGGMHCVALTRDQRILTWGVNDNGALGRDTTWEAPTRDIDADSDEDDDEDTLNPKESTPTAVPSEFLGGGDKTFVLVAATDSASFALADDGSVYGWGTFRGNDGTMGFFTADAIAAVKENNQEKKFQRRPALIPELKKITMLAAGENHVHALDHKGNVFAWGAGEQSQLGRRIVDRTRFQALTPCQFGLPRNKITHISCGAFHSFAIDVNGQVYSWGLNNFGQTGIATGAGESEAFIERATVVKSLKPYKIKDIKGGNFHSIACTEDGKLLTWGRCDDGQAGMPLKDLPKEDLLFDSHDKARVLIKPTIIPDINANFVAAGNDNSIAITNDGKAYSWGFSENYQTGLGTQESVKEATLIENTAVKGKVLSFAGCGGQFSVLAGPATTKLSNGV